jgi:hypothetical protein
MTGKLYSFEPIKHVHMARENVFYKTIINTEPIELGVFDV